MSIQFLLGLGIFTFLVVTTAKCADTHWHYELGKTNQWVDEYPDCGGSSQSPINIETSKVKKLKNLYRIMFKNYDTSYLFNFTNNGHTVISNQFVDTIGQLRPIMYGSDLVADYELQQFHFHWGSNASFGSEHTVNGKSYAGELHLVHRSAQGKYAVLGFFIDVGTKVNQEFANLLKAVKEEESEDGTYSTVYINLLKILPNMSNLKNRGYYRYSGSLTTPPCTEGIIWTVFKTPITISPEQMRAFYVNELKFNSRPTQNLNSRIVTGSTF